MMDGKDFELYKALNENGREKLTALSKILDFSVPTTKDRLEKLIDKDKIAIKGLMNIQNNGWKTAVCSIQAENMEEAYKLADRFKECPKVIFAMTTSGNYNLFLILVGDSTAILESTIENDIRPISTIKKLDVFMGDTPLIPKYVDIRVNEKKESSPCGAKPCNECYLYEKRCMGCPATTHFIGIDASAF